MSKPADGSERSEFCTALGDVVEVARILPVADTNPCSAKDLKSRELAALRMLRRPSIRVRMKHLRVGLPVVANSASLIAAARTDP